MVPRLHPDLHTGCAVVVLPARLGAVLPAAALPALRAAAVVYADPSVPDDLAAAAGADPAPGTAELAQRAAAEPVVLLTADPSGDAALALDGATVVRAPAPPGAGLLEAAAVMDRLRSPGGCPWDAEQTHESLRQYLLEETYELLEAIELGDRAALREELGDVLLQVLFHARIAAEHADASFDVDDVARDLVAKLVRRHPHVFDVDDAVHDAASQERRWEELKAAEKPRTSIVDGVAFGQPALSLAAKLARRAARAGIRTPPDGDTVGERLFGLAAQAALSGEDPELAVRGVARRFASQLLAEAAE
jgi:XTP/dITP diphosphohydrolase